MSAIAEGTSAMFDDDDEDRRSEIQHDHGGHELPGNVTDPPYAADDDHAHEHSNDDSGQPRRHAEAVPERSGHRVDLNCVPDSERGERAEDGESKSKVLPEFRSKLADAVAQVVHRSTNVLAGSVDLSIGDGTDGFRILCCHPEQGR